MVSSALPSPSQFSALDTNSATDTLCFTLTSCLDNFCPLSSRPARATPSAPWLSDVLREHRAKLRAAERKWHNSKNSTDLSVYQSHLSSFSANVSTAKMTYYHNKINNCSDSRALFKTFSSLLCPPPPPPSSTLTADDFATFFTNKTKTISDQFLTPQTNNNFITTNTQSLTSFSPLSETEVSKLILSNHPTTCPLDPIPTHLLQAISSSVIPALTHIINTSLHTGTFPTAFKQARVSPLLKKPALNPALLENYRPVSLLPFIAKSLERVVFNQLSLFLAQNNILDNNHNLASEVATQLRLPYYRLQRPWDWQEQLPNPLYSSCWICLLPLTQLTTRSSCPSSERWASQEPPSCGSSLTSQIGPSGCLGGVRFRSHNFLLLEFLKAQCLDHFSSPSTCRH